LYWGIKKAKNSSTLRSFSLRQNVNCEASRTILIWENKDFIVVFQDKGAKDIQIQKLYQDIEVLE